MESRTPEPDDKLLAHLDGMSERLRELVEVEFVRNPDDLAACLDLDVAFVQDSIETIMADASPSPRSLIDLNEIVDHACRELLFAMEIPIVITSSMDPLLPKLHHSYEILLAAVLHALQMIADHAGSDGELFIETSTDGYTDVLEIRSTSRGRPQDRPTEQRVASLADLIHGVGSNDSVSVSVEPTGEIAKLSLSFETRVSTT